MSEIKPIEPCKDCIHFGTVFEEHTMPGQRPVIGYGCRRIANGEVCKFEPYPKTDMEKAAEQLQEIKKEMAISLEKDMAKLTESLKKFNKAISKMLPSIKDFEGRKK